MAAEVVCADVDERRAVLEAELARLPPLGLGAGRHHHHVHLGVGNHIHFEKMERCMYVTDFHLLSSDK